MYKKGISCSPTASESSRWNDSCTPVLQKFISTNASETPACTISGAYGVRYCGCTRPSHAGMYESSPATNGMRAEPPSHADPMPAIDKLSKNANGATIHATPTLDAMCETACTIPCSTLICDLLTAISKVSVAPMYNKPDRTPPHATAPGSVLAGS